MKSRVPTATAETDQVPPVLTLNEPRYSQSLERGFAILRFFTPERPELGIVDLADGLGVAPSTTHRYVVTLAALGYLEQVAPSHKYKLGLRVTDLGMSARNSIELREHAHDYLDQLRRFTGYTVSLAVLDGTDIVYVDQTCSRRRGTGRAELNMGVGMRLPFYCTAVGKLLIANLPESELEKILERIDLAKRGPNTITSKAVLCKELEQIWDDGFAVDDQEMAANLHGIAVPVRDGSREVVGALDVTANANMVSLTQMVNSLIPHLVSTADRISARLGYRRGEGSKNNCKKLLIMSD